jgi:hypothetical protein
VAAPSEYALPSVQAAVVAPYTAAGYESAGTVPQQPSESLPAATAAAVGGAAGPRRACEGGVMVAVAGNKYKCKYRRPKQAVTGL